MDTKIFQLIIKWFCCKVEYKDHQVYLIMDNFSNHKFLKNLTDIEYEGGLKGVKYRNIIAIYLLSNITSIIQPLDQGIIIAFKSYFHRFQLIQIQKRLDKRKELVNIKVSLYQALIQTCNTREYVYPKMIRNCFIKANILLITCNSNLINIRERKISLLAITV